MNRRSEEGFTLVELLVTTMILGVVVGAVAASLIVGLKTTDDTNQRLAESHDAQMAAVYFAADAQNADDVSLSDGACGGVPVVRFLWSEASPAIQKVASYAVVTSGAERRLVRHYCENGVLVRDVVIAHELGTTDPAVACTPVPACTPTSGGVSISVTTEGGYAFSLSGSRRTT